MQGQLFLQHNSLFNILYSIRTTIELSFEIAPIAQQFQIRNRLPALKFLNFCHIVLSHICHIVVMSFVADAIANIPPVTNTPVISPENLKCWPGHPPFNVTIYTV